MPTLDIPGGRMAFLRQRDASGISEVTDTVLSAE
jgi:hypothetical protein